MDAVAEELFRPANRSNLALRRDAPMRLTMLLVLSVLCACATGYQSRGLSGGHSETQLDENVFEVSFHGNGYTSRERAADFTLLRSADVAREHGYGFFIIVEKGDRTSYGSYTSPSQSYTTGTASSYGNTAYGSSSTTTYGGHAYLIRKPGLANTIVCFKDKPEGQGLVYNAEFISRSLRSKYGMQP